MRAETKSAFGGTEQSENLLGTDASMGFPAEGQGKVRAKPRGL